MWAINNTNNSSNKNNKNNNNNNNNNSYNNVLLKNRLSKVKLLDILRMTDCSSNPLRKKFDEVLWLRLSTILNVDLSYNNNNNNNNNNTFILTRNM